MKKLIQYTLIIVCLAFSTIIVAQPTMDGVFDGTSVWGTAIESADNLDGFAFANAKKLFFTECGDYLYFGAEVKASDWMNWAFVINTKAGGGATESWSRSIDYNHSNLPDYVLRGHFDSYAQYHNWDGTSWVGLGVAIGATEFGENIVGTNQIGWVECRVLKSFVGEVSTGDVQFYITGDNDDHGTFDAVPDDENAIGWDHSSNHTVLDNFNTGVSFGNPLVSITPGFPLASENVTLTFDASCTDLEGHAKVYLHSGISVSENANHNFDYAVGNWGMDDGVGEMTDMGGDQWEFSFTSFNSYYNVDTEDDVFGFNFLFRSTDGDTVENHGGANFHYAVDPGDYFTISSPSYQPYLVETNNSFDVNATANNAPTTWTLYEIDPNTDAVISTITTQTGGLTFMHGLTLVDTNLKKYKLESNFSGTVKYKTFKVIAHDPVSIVSRPSWTNLGVNYHTADATKATLVLHAPTYTTYKNGNGGTTGTNTTTEKEVVYLIGDFNNWTINESYKMNRDRDGWDGSVDADNDGDHGDYWWIELSGLTPGQEYIFQFYMDGGVQVGDPYCEKLSDPDDQYISAMIYPSLISYPVEAIDRASVLQTNQSSYTWTADTYEKPERNDLNIYELHFRDFTEEGTYVGAIDKLDHIKGLGINAIHVMPVSEFEGNSSWGYNPNFYFAPDKAYGTRNDLKMFVDECHKREILVFNDLVLNHAFYSNVQAKMYWNNVDNKPANENPWFNADHKMVADQAGWWGADWNHESEHTQVMVDSILNYWMTEYHFDGFRFDFTKGFGQTAQDPGDPWAGSYDQNRIDLLTRMVDGMWDIDTTSIVIFEHLANSPEEKVLANYGILLWSGVGHHNKIKNFILGYNTDDTNIYSSGIYNSPQNDFTYANLMSYPESHDEQRLAYELSQYYNGPKTIENIVDRMKLGLIFNIFFPGPRMLWQMEELAYDISIDFNGRTGEKPVKWDYYDDVKRKELYRLLQRVFKLRNKYDIYNMSPDYGNISLGTGNITTPRHMSFDDGNGHHIIVIANIDTIDAHSLSPNYDVTGTWYQYNGDLAVDGTTFTVNTTADTYSLDASSTRILTNFDMDDCLDVVNTFNTGYGSLREAISCASSGDTINFDYIVWNDTILVETPLIINKDLYIITTDKNIVIDGSTSSHVFEISMGSQVYLQGFQVICGTGSSGRCIDNEGELNIENSIFIDDNHGTNSSILNSNNGNVDLKGNVKLKN